MNFSVGEQLRKVRASRELTLDKTAELTGVSKPMLCQIESGRTSPTINTLWKIATGLKAPLSLFLSERNADYTVSEPTEQNVIFEENGSMRAYTLFPYDPIRSFEAFYIEFDAGCRHCSDKHSDNVTETVFVVSGGLDIIVDGHTISIAENQAARFSADAPHIYHNRHDGLCRVYNTIFY